MGKHYCFAFLQCNYLPSFHDIGSTVFVSHCRCGNQNKERLGALSKVISANKYLLEPVLECFNGKRTIFVFLFLTPAPFLTNEQWPQKVSFAAGAKSTNIAHNTIAVNISKPLSIYSAFILGIIVYVFTFKEGHSVPTEGKTADWFKPILVNYIFLASFGLRKSTLSAWMAQSLDIWL